MENRKSHPVNEIKVVDDHGKEYTVFQYQEGTEKPSLKWIKAGPTWFGLSDGTTVDSIDDSTFKIPMIDKVLRRRPNRSVCSPCDLKTRIRSNLLCPLWVKSGHRGYSILLLNRRYCVAGT